MLQSNAAVALLRALLRDDCASDLVALKHMSEAARLRMDPLDYCAHLFGLGNQLVWLRAAQWAGYVGAAELPSHPALPQGQVDSLERLGEVRSLRQHVLGKDLVFVAPTFPQVLSLARSRSPHLVDRVRFAPPEAIERGMARAASTQLMDNARQNTTRLWPHASAAVSLPKSVRIGLMLGLTAMILVVMAAGAIFRPVLVPLVAALLMAPGLLRLFAAVPTKPRPDPPRLPDMELPIYTVLIPLRDEAQMVPMLQRAMLALDYPPHRLDIKFVVESRSPETIVAVEYLLADPRFRMVVVPEGRPHTKPKALDYALPLARGEYLVVYDAEDVPEPDQLRRAAERFAADPGVACLQAELMLENANETVLTALFAGEYAGLFGRLLPALVRLGVPVPLGGTSNHFRTSVLRAIGGWDAFNVTEDADLGVRLARRGYRAETFSSHTLEEAPLTILAWMNQRTRWMKGWMQTFAVHNRSPLRFLKDVGWRGFIGFQVLVGGMILSSLLHTVFIGTLLAPLLLEGEVRFMPQDAWDWLSIIILLTGYGGAIAVVVSGIIHQKQYHLLPMQVATPFYWVLHSIAALKAAGELINDPSSWSKTTHGVTRLSRNTASAGAAAPMPQPLTQRIG